MLKQSQQLRPLSNDEMKQIKGGHASQSLIPKYKYNCTGTSSATWTECIYESEHPNNCPGAVCVPDGSCTVYTGYACD